MKPDAIKTGVLLVTLGGFLAAINHTPNVPGQKENPQEPSNESQYSPSQQALESELQAKTEEIAVLKASLAELQDEISRLQQENERKPLINPSPLNIPVYLSTGPAFLGTGTLYWKPVNTEPGETAWSPYLLLPDKLKTAFTQVVTNVVERPANQAINYNNIYPSRYYPVYYSVPVLFPVPVTNQPPSAIPAPFPNGSGQDNRLPPPLPRYGLDKLPR